MKILITVSGSWGTGSFEVARAVMEELLELGHEVKVFFPSKEDLPAELSRYREHFEIWRFPIKGGLDSFPLLIPDPHPGNPTGEVLSQLTEDQRTGYLEQLEAKLKEVIEAFQPDVIECQHIWTNAVIVHKLGYPYICSAHHVDQLSFLEDERMQSALEEVALGSKYIFVPSKFVRKEVIELYGIPKRKIIRLPCGYDEKVFKVFPVSRTEVLQELGIEIPETATIVSFPGKISRTKGIDLLLMANQLISAEENVHFLILGAGELHELVEEEPHTFKNVHFLGHQSPKMIAKIHNICKFCVLPSRSEAFGIALLEAMACGLPVITTKFGGPIEFAVGAFVDPENSKKLAKAILKFLHMPKRRYERLSRRALRRAHAFAWKNWIRKRLECYARV